MPRTPQHDDGPGSRRILMMKLDGGPTFIKIGYIYSIDGRGWQNIQITNKLFWTLMGGKNYVFGVGTDFPFEDDDDEFDPWTRETRDNGRRQQHGSQSMDEGNDGNPRRSTRSRRGRSR